MNYIETIIVACIMAIVSCFTVATAHDIHSSLTKHIEAASQVEIIGGIVDEGEVDRHVLDLARLYEGYDIFAAAGLDKEQITR